MQNNGQTRYEKGRGKERRRERRKREERGREGKKRDKRGRGRRKREERGRDYCASIALACINKQLPSGPLTSTYTSVYTTTHTLPHMLLFAHSCVAISTFCISC